MSSMTNTTSSSSSTQIMRWNSPTPYLFGGLALILGIIVVALATLACSYIYKKKHQPSSSFDDTTGKPVTTNDDYDDKPKFVVIMAGDDKPTYIAMPINAKLKRIEEKDRISELPDELLYDLEMADRLVHRVNKALEEFNGGKLNTFRIVHPVCKRSKSDIDEWISFAIRNRVSELELDFEGGARRDGFGNYDVPLNAYSSLENLRVCCTCGLVNAKNTAPHQKLKSLKLYNCYGMKNLELLAPNLVSFNFEAGFKRFLCIKDAPRLASLSLSVYRCLQAELHPTFPREKDFIFDQFSSYLPKLESMVVTVALFEDMSNFTKLCVFSNLKTLFPSRKASLEAMEAFELPIMSPHKNLKEVKLSGFKADVYTRYFLVYLVECTYSLQKINFSPYGTRRVRDSLIARTQFEWSADDAENYKICVQELRKILNTNVQLIFHD
uniref:Uncharacterized protein n=1 Tax=Chenopodium quinoa TaxID=63459 RepID=A0A803LC53_CHEQI